MINRTYGHLGTIQHRAEVVKSRIERFAELAEVRRRLRPPRAA